VNDGVARPQPHKRQDMISRSFFITAHVCLFLTTLSATSLVWASPLSSESRYRLPVVARQATVQPYFPDTPASCPICAKGYSGINSCAQAAPVLANLTTVIFNPGAFISVIKCACTDTFQSTFPQCADCFEKTNQTAVLDTPDLPSLVKNIRELCASESSILGNVSNSDGETTPSPTGSAASSSTSASSAVPLWNIPGLATVSTVVAGAVSLIIFGVSLL